MMYPKPKPRGKPRICDEHIKWIRELHGEGKSYAYIAWKTGFSPTTARRYCVGESKDYLTLL